MISDYSSTYFDYSILNRPMFCFAYDLEEYEEKRGLYLNIYEALPCPVNETEDELLNDVLSCDYEARSKQTESFHMKYAPNAGNATSTVVRKLTEKLN